MLPKKKKTFYLDKDEKKPVVAGGVILYRFVKDQHMELLLIESRGNYEDFGGCADDDDENIFAMVAREAFEESNKLLDFELIKKRLTHAQFAYAEKSKYVVYVIKATKGEERLNGSDFGDKEIHDNIARLVKWIPLDTFLMKEVIQNKLNWRLKNTTLFNILKDIKNDKKCDTSMFSNSSKNSKSDSDNDRSDISDIKIPKKSLFNKHQKS